MAFEVAIIGGGASGLTALITLIKHGVNCKQVAYARFIFNVVNNFIVAIGYCPFKLSYNRIVVVIH